MVGMVSDNGEVIPNRILAFHCRIPHSQPFAGFFPSCNGYGAGKGRSRHARDLPSGVGSARPRHGTCHAGGSAFLTSGRRDAVITRAG